MIKPTRLGHAVLRVRDLKRSEEFYSQFLGLEVTGAVDSMVFFGSNIDVHHDLAIIKVADYAHGPEQTGAGLYHLAFEFDSFDQVKEAYRLANVMGIRIARFGDHGDTKGLYGLDPDRIEIELYAFAPEYKDTPLKEVLTRTKPQPDKARRPCMTGITRAALLVCLIIQTSAVPPLTPFWNGGLIRPGPPPMSS